MPIDVSLSAYWESEFFLEKHQCEFLHWQEADMGLGPFAFTYSRSTVVDFMVPILQVSFIGVLLYLM